MKVILHFELAPSLTHSPCSPDSKNIKLCSLVTRSICFRVFIYGLEQGKIKKEITKIFFLSFFGHNFLPTAVINLIFWPVIYIFAKYFNRYKGQLIFGAIVGCTIRQFSKIGQIWRYGLIRYGHEYDKGG